MGEESEVLVLREGTNSAMCPRVMGQYIGQPPAGEAHGSGCRWPGRPDDHRALALLNLEADSVFV